MTPSRTERLGLIAELRGGGADFVRSSVFLERTAEIARDRSALRDGRRYPHSLKIVVNRPPSEAVEFARAARAIAVPVIFAVPHGGSHAGAGRRSAADADVLRSLVAMGHELALQVDASVLRQAEGGLDVAVKAALAPHSGAKLPVVVATLRHERDAAFDMATLDAELLKALAGAGVERVIDARCFNREREVVPDFVVAERRGALVAASADPAFEIHETPSGDLDELSVRALLDTVARGSCVHTWRLSSVV